MKQPAAVPGSRARASASVIRRRAGVLSSDAAAGGPYHDARGALVGVTGDNMDRVIKGAILVAALLLLHGCATAYGKRGMTGGYSDQRLDDTHYIVRFDGNGYASGDRVWYFWIYRCAQLTAYHGYTYFSLDRDDPRLTASRFDPTEGATLQPAVLTDRAGGGLVPVAGAGTFIYIPGGTVTTWHSAAVVAMYKDDLPADKPFLDAAVVLRLLNDYVAHNGKDVPPARDALLNEAGFVLGPDHKLVNIHQYLLKHPPAKRHAYRFPWAPPPPAPTAPPAPPYLAAPQGSI